MYGKKYFHGVKYGIFHSRTVRYTDIPKISVLNQYRYIDTGYSAIPDLPKFPIYRNFSVYRVTFTNYMAKP
jgi:hypothetical protein